MHRKFFGALLLTAAIVAAGCDNDVENQTPTEPAPTTTDTFTGTINVNGAQTHTFNVLASGTATATLSEVTPDNTIAVGLELGEWNGVSCASKISNGNALQGNALIGNVTGIGTLCVRVHDTGKLTGALDYKVTVVHP